MHTVSLRIPSTVQSRLHKFVEYLTARGHSGQTIHHYRRAVEHFVQWRSSQKASANNEAVEDVERFLARHLPRCRCQGPVIRSTRTLRAALHLWLRMDGQLASPTSWEKRCSQPIVEAIRAFDDYMRKVAGLAVTTRHFRCRCAAQFLQTQFGSGPLVFSHLTPAAVNDYVSARVKHLTPVGARGVGNGIRSYLKFLQFNQQGSPALVAAVPSAPVPRQGTLPVTLSGEEIVRLLAAFDRTTCSGKRNFAMACCLIDLGLRTCEVAALKLDEIRWHEGIVLIGASKTSHADWLPLPCRTGEAIADYLRYGRPTCTSSAVFVHHRAPYGMPVRASTVRGAIRRGYQRASIGTQRVHALRHTAATRMLCAGVSFKGIADVLRHRSLDTTTIYCKVDSRLITVALPWPEYHS